MGGCTPRSLHDRFATCHKTNLPTVGLSGSPLLDTTHEGVDRLSMLPVQQVRRSVIDEVDIILQRRIMSCNHEYFFGAVSHIRCELFR